MDFGANTLEDIGTLSGWVGAHLLCLVSLSTGTFEDIGATGGWPGAHLFLDRFRLMPLAAGS